MLNDIDADQLISSRKTRHATPTTFVNIRKGKQGRHIEWMGLFLLFDSVELARVLFEKNMSSI